MNQYFIMISVRQSYVVAGMLFLAIVNIILMRECLSLTITRMVKSNFNAEISSVRDEEMCPMGDSGSEHNGTSILLSVSVEL